MTPIESAAARLNTARRTGEPCDPIRDLLVGGTVADAYAVQHHNTNFR